MSWKRVSKKCHKRFDRTFNSYVILRIEKDYIIIVFAVISQNLQFVYFELITFHRIPSAYRKNFEFYMG